MTTELPVYGGLSTDVQKPILVYGNGYVCKLAAIISELNGNFKYRKAGVRKTETYLRDEKVFEFLILSLRFSSYM